MSLEIVKENVKGLLSIKSSNGHKKHMNNTLTNSQNESINQIKKILFIKKSRLPVLSMS